MVGPTQLLISTSSCFPESPKSWLEHGGTAGISEKIFNVLLYNLISGRVKSVVEETDTFLMMVGDGIFSAQGVVSPPSTC